MAEFAELNAFVKIILSALRLGRTGSSDRHAISNWIRMDYRKVLRRGRGISRLGSGGHDSRHEARERRAQTTAERDRVLWRVSPPGGQRRN